MVTCRGAHASAPPPGLFKRGREYLDPLACLHARFRTRDCHALPCNDCKHQSRRVLTCDNRAIGGLLGNLKSGRGVFGEEMTTKYAKQALNVVEEQVLEVAREIREEEGAQQVKKSDKAVKAATIERPQYTKDDKWDVVLTGPGAEPLEVSVRPTSRVGLLLKAWATEYGGDSVDYQLEVKSGSSWTSGVANAESLIGDSGVVDGLQVVITKI